MTSTLFSERFMSAYGETKRTAIQGITLGTKSLLMEVVSHMRHISVATTEGYASRPGGAQAELLAEVNKYEPSGTYF
jgi:hypothetical protein